MMKRLLLGVAILFSLGVGALVVALFVWPRPPDTTDPRIFGGGAGAIDHCDLSTLNGAGLLADDIPKAFTPGCGYERFPLPILADCAEPLAEGVVDLRGLWLAEEDGPLPGHVERIEQCGNRLIVTAGGVIHDFRTDGTLLRGSRDIEPPSCMNTWVSIEWQDGVLRFHPFGLPMTIVRRWRDGDDLVWTYPRFDGEIRMTRICQVPDRLLGSDGRSGDAV